MISFAIKHIVSDHGSISKAMKDIKDTPYAFSSKEKESKTAAKGNFVYVLEVVVESNKRKYLLSYKYKAHERFQRPSGLWKGAFKYKISATPGVPSVGEYLEPSVEVLDSDFHEWFSNKQPGMAQIPSHLVGVLDDIFADPRNGAKTFT